MIRKQKLANGLTLLTERMPDVRSVTVGIWLRRGSRHEPRHLNGISHFIEHLVFKGTESRSARDIALAMDSIGGQMDAFTSKEYTCFYAKVLDEHLADAIDLLGDIVRRPLFDAAELERERQVVLEEIRMVEDTPDDLIYDLLSEAFYPGHNLGRPIQGTTATVSAFTRRQLLEFFRRSYRPENMLVVAAGNLDHQRLGRRVTKMFGSMERGRRDGRKAPVPRANPAVVMRPRRELEQLHLLVALPAYPERFSRRYPLYVLNALLGGTMSSRLFQKIREERGLAYSVYSGIQGFLDTGMLVIYVGTSPGAGREVVGLVLDELRDLAARGPDAAELAVAKEHIKGSLMLSLESTGSRMSNLARSEIYFGRQRDLEDILDSVERVTVRQVHRLAQDMLGDRQAGLAAVGRVAKLKIGAEELRL
jgi:predicted Zn-dependent peptidase